MFSRKLYLYLGLNVLVSAVTVSLVLWFWNSVQSPKIRATPTPLPTATGAAVAIPTAEPTNKPAGKHIIEAGDTLGYLADIYDVTVPEIVAANGFADENVILNIGDEVIIPAQGSALLTPIAAQTLPPPTPLPIATSANTVIAGQPSLAIRAVQSPGDLTGESVLLTNVGSVAVELENWTLRNQHSATYTFPKATLYDGGQVVIHSGSGQNSATDLYWNNNSAVWQSGEIVSLHDPSGAIHTTFTIP